MQGEEIINNKRRILAKYNKTTIRVYQAYNNKNADEALKLGKYGDFTNFPPTLIS